MASALKWILGQPSPSPSETASLKTKTTKRGLPASWYRSPELYQLERRAIFSRKWLLVTHKNRFGQPGDLLRFTEAGFDFFLCLDREGKLGGFFNICRHRGFPLVHKEQDHVKILACKYHGWSYGLNGKLAKAPHFEQFPDFDKEENGLLPIHVHIDALGFVWVNLDTSSPTPEPWSEQFEGVDTQDRLQSFNFQEYRFDHTWGMQGDYNWKTLADNYNECLHCRTAHPDTNGVVDVTVYRETGLNEGKVQIASTFFYPNACTTVSPHYFYMMRCVPTSATTCSMEYEVYRHQDASDEDFNNIDQIYKRVLTEDKWLCNNTQRNLEAGVFVNGQMHPDYEFGPLYFQSLVKEWVLQHHAEEQKQKKQIWPAAQQLATDTDTNTRTTQDEIAFCAGLECGPDAEPRLAW
ncbi:hypothetical protein A1O3_01528 [Capronia epimyces CBS 606.96]|uniref:Choline monooxygenase, chloroplastic n=1 Tax=Capronia epimyces CBS 606.96 TaxID=1182542 RepID=W9YJA5_9EURO|nr:uncharacterized protein A1O3_01528 [Capronia epimyces CBS 606.96]EXJ92972.1 hypothetical protein A1O3_01528 [Capronia epimyces CBS 606.96]